MNREIALNSHWQGRAAGLGKRVLAQTERLPEIVPQDFAGMHRREFLGLHRVSSSRNGNWAQAFKTALREDLLRDLLIQSPQRIVLRFWPR